jgi:CheY-like chemotaxis protein
MVAMNTPNSSPGSTPVRILIVDDHPNTAATFARAISQFGPGIDVISSDSGEKALEQVRDKSVDMLITDMVMPGMNGLELIERMQSHPGGRPSYTVLITAYDVPGVKESARRLKVNEFVIKPVKPERICQIVANALKDMGRAQVSQINTNTKAPPRILIADDLQDNVTLLARFLQNEGYVCISASNGLETLEKVHTELPDMLLLDVNMPGKDGFEVLQEIRADPAVEHLPVIILTAARIDSVDLQACHPPPQQRVECPAGNRQGFKRPPGYQRIDRCGAPPHGGNAGGAARAYYRFRSQGYVPQGISYSRFHTDP